MIMIEIDGNKLKAGTYISAPLEFIDKKYSNWLKYVGSIVQHNFPKEVLPHDPKGSNKKIKELLGISPSRFVSIWNARMVEAYIPNDIRHLASKVCRARGGNYIPKSLRAFVSNRCAVKEAEKDGLIHLIPLFCMFEGATTKSLKKRIGKSLWKSLCRNSFTRNLLIVRSIYFFLGSTSTKYLRNRVRNLTNTPSSLLKKGLTFNKTVTDLLTREKMLTGRKQELFRISHMIQDTVSMGKTLGLNLAARKDIKTYTLSRWRQMHDQFIEDINKKNNIESKKEIKWLAPYDKEYASGKYSAILLTTKYAIKEEGQIMKHCVGSYGES